MGDRYRSTNHKAPKKPFNSVKMQGTIRTKSSGLKRPFIASSPLPLWDKPAPCASQENIISAQRSLDGGKA